MKKLISALLCLIALPCFAAEDPIVTDGLTIPTYLNSNDGSNNVYSEDVTSAFTTTASSSTVTVKHALVAPFNVTITAGVTKFSLNGTSPATVGGLTMDGTWTVATTPDSTHFTFTHSGAASSSVTNTGSTTIAYSTAGQEGKLRFLCEFSHLGYDDPIVNPGQPGAAHLHLFFGNTLTNANSTYASLRASGDGTCDGGPLNRTAYWMPAMIDSSVAKVRVPLYFEWYYNNTERAKLVSYTSPTCPGNLQSPDNRPIACSPPQQPLKKIERGMRAVFGFRPSANSYPASYMVGGVTGGGGTPLPQGDILASAWVCQSTGGLGAINLTKGYRYLSHRSTPSLGLTSNTGTFTVTIASPAVITDIAHGRAANEYVGFTTTGALPTDTATSASLAAQGYYVKTVTDADHYTISATPGGTVVNTSGSQSGVHTRGCSPSGGILIRVDSPVCWDGTHDNADHYSHFAPTGNDGSGNAATCPATHPNNFLAFTVIAQWPYSGGIASVNNWYLSSDRHNGANFEPGETFHWDEFWGWNDNVQEHFHEKLNGMYPSSSTGAPYVWESAGKEYVGGPYLRSTSDGGLGADCTNLGLAGPCSLITHTGRGIKDVLMDIPPIYNRKRGRLF